MYQFITPNSHITLSSTDIYIITILLIWATIWKAIALWKSARNNQVVWFIAIILVNSLGILEILYIVFFQKNRRSIPDKEK